MIEAFPHGSETVPNAIQREGFAIAKRKPALSDRERVNAASSFGWSSLVLPACAAIAVGLFVAAMHPPGMRKNAGKGRRQRRPPRVP